jgi:hypothetical protein
MSHLTPYVIFPDDTSEVVYAAVRDGHDDIVKQLITQGFESTDSIPGWSEGNGWSLFIRRLFAKETV